MSVLTAGDKLGALFFAAGLGVAVVAGWMLITALPAGPVVRAVAFGAGYGLLAMVAWRVPVWYSRCIQGRQAKADTPTCPHCGGGVVWDYTCHTYPSGDGSRWASCMPCVSATRWICLNDHCGWAYEHGLNPDNPRAADNGANRPPWLPQDSDHEQCRHLGSYICGVT